MVDGLLDKGFNRLMAGNEAAPVNWGGKVGKVGKVGVIWKTTRRR